MGNRFMDLKVKNIIPLVILVILGVVFFSYIFSPKAVPKGIQDEDVPVPAAAGNPQETYHKKKIHVKEPAVKEPKRDETQNVVQKQHQQQEEAKQRDSKEKEGEVLTEEEKIERDVHIPPELLDMTKFVKAEKHVEKEGCPVVEHCEHMTCPSSQHDRIIRIKEDGCRECACVLE